MLARDVEVRVWALLRSCDPDDLEGGMVLRIEELPLQRFQTAAEDVGLGGVQSLGQTLQALLLAGVQVDLSGHCRDRETSGVVFVRFGDE